jgi:signal transduction histidine kinase
MARELARGRERALEAERNEAFRETARRVAHELKNPLTPIRFAVDRLRRDAVPGQADAVEVLTMETARLDAMARSFAQFGRLPDGPAADVDIAELARWAAKSTVPESLPVDIEVPDDIPLVRGHYDALLRALSNVLLNAVDACGGSEACGETGRIVIGATRTRVPITDADAVEVSVRDTGCGMSSELLAHIWDPYVTQKPNGTGLGLAIARQTIVAHGGAVDAVSAVGRGTEIRFILPIAGPPAAGVSWSESI